MRKNSSTIVPNFLECSDTASNTVEPTSVSIAPSITSTPPAAAAKEEENVENTRTDTEEGATATAPESSINNGTKRWSFYVHKKFVAMQMCHVALNLLMMY